MRIVDRARSLRPRPPLVLAAALAATVAFGLALLVGWATAGSREQLGRAEPRPTRVAVPKLAPLGRTVALPPAPPVRARRRAVPQPQPRQPQPKPKPKRAQPPTPTVIVGSG